MPGGDGTGPMGFGPQTGRAAGYRAGYGIPGYANLGYGRGYGLGCGRGGGRGWRNRFYATGLTGWQRAAVARPPYAASAPPVSPYPYPPAATKEQQVDAFKAQAEYLEGALSDIRKRLEEIEAQKK